jgi:hypothetical protein
MQECRLAVRLLACLRAVPWELRLMNEHNTWIPENFKRFTQFDMQFWRYYKN